MVYLRYALLLAALAGTATPANAAPEVSVSFTSTTLSVDADADGRADAGDAIRYEGTVSSTGDAAATSVTISVPQDPNVTGDVSTIFSNVIAIDDEVDTDEDTPVTLPAPGVAANDIDYPLPVSLTVTSTTSTGVLGQVSIAGSGELTYNPNGQFESLAAGESAVETLTYAVTDAQDNTDTATVTVNVAGVNDAPVAVSQSVITDEDTPIEITLVGTDVEVGTPLTFAIVPGSASDLGWFSGITPINANSAKVTFTPHSHMNSMSVGQSQLGSFTFTVHDGLFNSPAATVDITVTGSNDEPTFISGSRESFETIGNTQFTYAAASAIATPHLFLAGSLISNFSDPDTSDILTMSLVGSPSSGTVSLNSDGAFIYTPSPGNTGNATFTYRVSDGHVNVDRLATISHYGMVWYVKNNAVPGGTGVSSLPFNVLTDMQSPSAANDYIFVYLGDGTNTNQSSGVILKQGQRLLGEPIGLSIPMGLNNGPNPTVLVAANGGLSKPVVTNDLPGGNAVLCSSTSGAVPAEIAGLNLSASTNAIDLTIAAANGASGLLSIHDNVITNAGIEGIDINHSGTGSVTVSMQNNTIASIGTAIDGSKDSSGHLTLTINNNTNLFSSGASGINLDGAIGTGALNVTSLLNNTISGNTAGAGISANSVRFDSNPLAAGWQTVAAGTTAIGQSGNGVGGSGLSFSNVTGDLQFTGLSSFADGAAAVSIAGNGTFNAATATGLRIDVGPAAIAVANSGTALIYSNLTALGTYSSIISANAAASGVSLSNVSGTVAITAGAITDATAADFSVNTCTAIITYGGTIADATGQMVSINGCTGGSTSFSGALGNSAANTGGAISLLTNPGTTINFTGGLTCNTGAAAAFTATGGGTVNATGTNKLTASTATALTVQNTTIGGSGLKFVSINCSNASSNPGINLLNTGSSGGLSVTGVGSNAGSGGSISNKTSDGILLVGTRNVSLSNMTISNNLGNGNPAATPDVLGGGVVGTNVINFSATGCSVTGNADQQDGTEAGFRFQNLVGNCAIANCTFSGQPEDHVRITNDSGNLSNLAVTGSTFGGHSTITGGHGVSVINTLTANATVNVSDSTFIGVLSTAVLLNLSDNCVGTLNVTDNTFTDIGVAVTMGTSFSADMTFNISNNTSIRAISNAIQFVAGSTGTNTSTIRGTISGNTIGNGTADSGSRDMFGIAIDLRGDQDSIISILNNTVTNTDFEGIWVSSADFGVIASPNPGRLDLHLRDNTVGAPDDNSAFPIGFIRGTLVDIRHTTHGYLDIAGNTSAGIGGGEDFRFRQRDTAQVFVERLSDGDGIPGENITDIAILEAFFNGQNAPGSTSDVSLSGVPGMKELADGGARD